MRIIHLSSPSERTSLFESFDPVQSTWLVPDLKAKQVIQAQLFKTHDVIEENSVLRASELWRRILGQVRPDYQFVPEPLACTLIKHWLSQKETWAHTEGAVQLAYKYLTYFMPILSHQQGMEMLSEWFSQNPQAERRWAMWLKTCEDLWLKFNEEKLLVSPWSSAVLLNEDLNGIWEKSLIVDLGVHLQPIEAEIILNLSKHQDVTLIKLDPPWVGKSERLFRSYRSLDSSKPKAKKHSIKTKNNNNIKSKKFSSALAEVKDAVSTVRTWLERGVAPDQIAIVAPKAKDYWFCLQQFLDMEGIPYQKAKTVRMNVLNPIYAWLSQLNVEISNISGGYLENSFWARKPDQIHFDKFKRLFTHVYDVDDLSREALVKSYYKIEQDVLKLISRDDFIAWSLKRWVYEEEQLLVKLLNYFVKDCPSTLKLTLKDWLSYLQYVSSRSELTIEHASPNGIQVFDLTTSEFFSGSHLYIMGLSEDYLVQTEKVSVLAQDVFSIENQLGFQLNLIDNHQLEFEVKWLLERSYQEIILSCANADFQGEVLSPSRFILDYLGEATAVVPSKTRWDELRFQNEKLLDGSQISFKPFLPSSISASALEDYLSCPFLFASKRLFHLVDDPELDLDLDKMRTGRILHKLLYYLLEKPSTTNWKDEEIESLIDKCYNEEELILATPNMWPSLKKRYLQIAKRFLKAEKEYKEKYPTFKTLMREQAFEGYIDLKTGKLQKERGEVRIRGIIDRVDVNELGEAVIIDYKSSKPSHSNFSLWTQYNKLQLAIYAMALDAGLMPNPVQRVIGAQYYILKNLERVGGFVCTDTESPLYEVQDRKKNKVTEDQKQLLLEEIQKAIKGAIHNMQKGHFEAAPSKEVDCKKCRWRTVCRTDHLY